MFIFSPALSMKITPMTFFFIKNLVTIILYFQENLKWYFLGFESCRLFLHTFANNATLSFWVLFHFSTQIFEPPHPPPP